MIVIVEEMERVLSNAAASGKDVDYLEFFRLARDREFFFNVHTSGENSDKVFSVPFVQVGEGLNAVLFFVSNNNANLKKPFGGLVWEKILEMIFKMSQADGLIVQGEDSAWIAIDKKRIKLLMDGYKQ